jgi:hypothetical protein
MSGQLELRKCRQEHIKYIAPQDGQAETQLAYMQPDMQHVFENEFTLSAWAGSKCVGAAGLIQIMPHYAVAWAFIAKGAGPHMLEAVRAMTRVLDKSNFERIEMRVDRNFHKGHKLARLLGFRVEAPKMGKSGAFKEDETLYARVR